MSLRSSHPGNLLDPRGQLDVLRDDLSARVVGVQPDDDAVVDIVPVRVVIELLGFEGDPMHEAHRFAKGPELESLRQRVAFAGPSRQLAAGFRDLFGRKWGTHVRTMPRRRRGSNARTAPT